MNRYPISPAESHCCYYWENLLKERGDSSGATPIYNFYSERIWEQISDESHRLMPLVDTYKDSSQQAKVVYGDSPKPEHLQFMEQRLKILSLLIPKGCGP